MIESKEDQVGLLRIDLKQSGDSYYDLLRLLKSVHSDESEVDYFNLHGNFWIDLDVMNSRDKIPFSVVHLNERGQSEVMEGASYEVFMTEIWPKILERSNSSFNLYVKKKDLSSLRLLQKREYMINRGQVYLRFLKLFLNAERYSEGSSIREVSDTDDKSLFLRSVTLKQLKKCFPKKSFVKKAECKEDVIGHRDFPDLIEPFFNDPVPSDFSIADVIVTKYEEDPISFFKAYSIVLDEIESLDCGFQERQLLRMQLERILKLAELDYGGDIQRNVRRRLYLEGVLPKEVISIIEKLRSYFT